VGDVAAPRPARHRETGRDVPVDPNDVPNDVPVDPAPAVPAAQSATQPDHGSAPSVHNRTRPDATSPAEQARDAPSAGAARVRSGRSWLAVRPRVAVADRERLRTLLGWRYEAHARAVTSMLALLPGLRAGSGSDDLLAGLVAVRAYLAATASSSPLGLAVSAALRGGEPGSDDGDPVLLARCACVGLGRLPAVVGPVFLPAAADPAVVERYRTGDMLVEPAFLEVSTTPRNLPGRTVEYAIWSSTARRTDWLGLGGPAGGGASGGGASDGGGTPGRALFSAGTRLVVLGVDTGGETRGSAGSEGTPARVLLREAVGGRADSALDARALGRLRDVLPVPSPAGEHDGTDGGPPEQFRFAVGLDDDARAFAPDDARPTEDLEPAGKP
jgi:hypothetical protein